MYLYSKPSSTYHRIFRFFSSFFLQIHFLSNLHLANVPSNLNFHGTILLFKDILHARA